MGKNSKAKIIATLNFNCGWVVVALACNPSTLRGRGRQISEFEASLVYRVSSRTARGIQRDPVLKKNAKNKQTNKQRTKRKKEKEKRKKRKKRK